MNITSEFIKVNVKCKDWKEVVSEGVKILEDKGIVSNLYENAILRNFEEFGAYMVIAPSIVLLHARPEDGAISTGMSILILEDPICFGHESNDPVKLVFTLASKDNSDHTNILADLMKVLMDKDSLDSLMNACSVEKAIEIFSKN